MRFGRWTVVSPRSFSNGIRHLVICVCDCGERRQVVTHSLRSGVSRSCGCLAADEARERETTHGLTDDKLHHIWRGMLSRCRNPNTTSYKDYGGRGIRVCDRWLSFQNFYDDMRPTWQPGLTLERRNNDGNYEPSNCCWIPRSEQSKNRRGVTYLETPWGRMSLSEAARRVGIGWSSMHNRVRLWPQDRWFIPGHN